MANELGQDDPSKPESKQTSSSLLKSLLDNLNLCAGDTSIDIRSALLKIKQGYSKKLDNVELLVATGGLERLLSLLGSTRDCEVADITLSAIANCLTFAIGQREFYRLEGAAKVVPWLVNESSSCSLLARTFRCLGNLIEGDHIGETLRSPSDAALSIVANSVVVHATCDTVNKHASHRRCIYAALRVLCQFATLSSSRKIVLESKIFLLSIGKVLKCKTAEVVQCVLTCIQLFAAQDLSFAAQLAAGGAVETVVDLAKDNQAKIRQRAVLSLVHCVRESRCQQVVGRSGGLRVLLSHFQSSSRTSRRCVALLKALVTCCRDAECRSRAHCDGVLQAFIDILEDETSADLHVYIMQGLGAFYFDDVGLRIMVKRHGQRLLRVLAKRLTEQMCGRAPEASLKSDLSSVLDNSDAKLACGLDTVGRPPGDGPGDVRDCQHVDSSAIVPLEKKMSTDSAEDHKEVLAVSSVYHVGNTAQAGTDKWYDSAGSVKPKRGQLASGSASVEVQNELPSCVEKTFVSSAVVDAEGHLPCSVGVNTSGETVCDSAAEVTDRHDEVADDVHERIGCSGEAPHCYHNGREMGDHGYGSPLSKATDCMFTSSPSPLFSSPKTSPLLRCESPVQAYPRQMSPPPLSPPMPGSMSPPSMSPLPLSPLRMSPSVPSPSMSPRSMLDYSISPPLSPDLSSPPPTPQPITIPVPTMDMPPSATCQEVTTSSSSEVTLLSRFSQLRDCLPYLATDYVVTALVERLCLWPADASRCFRIVQRLVRDASCLQPLMVHRCPAILHRLLEERLPPLPKQAVDAGNHLLDDLSSMVESPYGCGTLAHVILKGLPAEQSGCVVSLLYVCRSDQERRDLFLRYGGRGLLLDLLASVPSRSDKWIDVVHGLAVLLTNHHIPFPGLKAQWSSSGSPVYAIPTKRHHDDDDGTTYSQVAQSCVEVTGKVTCEKKQCLHLLAGSEQEYDVTFLLPDGQRIPAHRDVLAACSDALHAMLLGSFAEAKMQCAIPIHGLRSDAFATMVHAAYGCPLSCGKDLGNKSPSQSIARTGEDATEVCSGYHDVYTSSVVQLTDSSACVVGKSPCWAKNSHNDQLCHLLQLIICADRYLMVDLRQRCALAIGEHLTVSNLSFVYDLGLCYSATGLIRRCLQFLLTLNMSDLLVVIGKLLEYDAVRFVEDLFDFLDTTWRQSACSKP